MAKRRGFYGPNGRLHGRPPSQASGMAPTVRPMAEGPVGDIDRKIKKTAKNIGNALLPGNPFGR